MATSPDVSKLLRRPQVGKPREEFEVPPPLPADEIPSPTPSLPPTPSLADALYAEADRVQELLQLLLDTAEEAEVPVPPELQALLGPQLRTRDYLAALDDPSPRAHRLRDHFERNLLSGCGLQPVFPVLAAPDLSWFRDTLLAAASAAEGKLIAGTVPASGNPHWGLHAAQALGGYHATLLTGSQRYRGRFAQAVLGMYGDLRGEFLGQVLGPALEAPLGGLRPVLQELLQLLRILRSLLCHAQLLQLLRFQQVRQLVANQLKELVLQQLTQVVSVLMQQAQEELTRPFLAFMTRAQPGTGKTAAEAVGDAVSRQVVSLLGETTLWMTDYYRKLAAELIRKLQTQNGQLEEKIHQLGRYAQIGRWVQHLDQATYLCNALLTVSGSAAGSQLLAFLERPLTAPPSELARRLSVHPDYRIYNPLVPDDTQVA